MPRTGVVTCVGAVTLDVIALVDGFPAVEGRTEARGILVTGGGPAANAAVVLARQGVPVAFVGVVGDDESGRQAVELLRREGVDVSGVEVTHDAQTQTSCIIVDTTTSSRSILTSRVPALTSLSEHAADLVLGSEWVHVDHRGYSAVTGLLAGRKRRSRVSLDSGNATVPNLDLSTIDLYVPSVTSLIAVAGVEDPDAAAAAALRAGCHAVVATEGARGSRAWWDDAAGGWVDETGPGTASAAAARDLSVVSTLGAGDVFHGALISALCRGLDWGKSLRWANLTAGLSCEGRDGREAVPSAERVRSMLEN